METSSPTAEAASGSSGSDGIIAKGSTSGGKQPLVQPRTSVPLKGKTYKLADPSAMPHTIGEEEEEDEEDDAASRPTTGGEGRHVSAMDDEAVVAAVMASGYDNGKGGSAFVDVGASGANRGAGQSHGSSWARDVAMAATQEGEGGDDDEAMGLTTGIDDDGDEDEDDLAAALARLQRASEVNVSAAAVAVAGGAGNDDSHSEELPTPSGLPAGGW